PEIGPADLVTLVPESLTQFWTTQLSASNLTLTVPTLTLFDADSGTPSCENPHGGDDGFYCAADNTIYINQPTAEEYIGNPILGDMSVGYLITEGYSENVQGLLGSQLTGEPRSLLDDCLTGVWIRDNLPPQPETGRPLYLSAGDLDEAIVTAIQHGDPASDTDVNGSAFEKTDAFRAGVLGGMQACQDRISQ
ncbi:MAG TPA: hypothetical protein VH761_12985, partial [Ilumatobacteraceae bacterium]